MFNSREQLLKALRNQKGATPLQIDSSDTAYFLENSTVNTLLCDHPLSRTLLASNIVFSTLKRSGFVVYVDLDTLFTVYLQHYAKNIANTENLVVFNPDDNNINEVMAQICSLEHIDLVVFDSVTVFAHLSHSVATFGVYVTLLHILASHSGAPILVTSFVKPKKTVRSGEVSWTASYAGGRILERMSRLILHVQRSDHFIYVNIVKSLCKDLENRHLILSLESLSEPFRHHYGDS